MQRGFRRGFSTLTQLAEFSHDICHSVDTGTQVDAIFIDFSKALDMVSHLKLLLKLNAILKNPQLVGWISSFLRQRTQFVSFNKVSSSIVPVSSGVPQGLVLGPLLFLLYINDLHIHIKSKIRHYADDSVLYSKISSFQDNLDLQESFSHFCSRSETWQ